MRTRDAYERPSDECRHSGLLDIRSAWAWFGGYGVNRCGADDRSRRVLIIVDDELTHNRPQGSRGYFGSLENSRREALESLWQAGRPIEPL